MNIVITKQLPNGVIIQAQSHDGRYQWFSGQDGYIRDTLDGRSIYQMAYLKRAGEGFGSDPLPDGVANDVRAFWASLNPLVAAREEAAERARIEREVATIDAREDLYRIMDSHMDPKDR
ncbi:hypothetical protein [Salinicola peritrichatus]|uniref:hypothetical protein n=1 Tax=Salinicola peritrichatus TaxID=1267424 RepID=UPI000DA115FE|nr:hypothetical protein [Salinicola peritrichatus]